MPSNHLKYRWLPHEKWLDQPQNGPNSVLIPCFSLLLMAASRDWIAPNCTIRHPVFQIVALQRRVRFSARLAGFCRVGVTRDALEGLKRPHFRYWSLISIFDCHVCAKGGERVADRAVQRRKRGRPRGPESRPGLPRRSRLARSGPGLRPGAWHPVAGRCFRCAYGGPRIADIASDTPQIWGSPWVDDDRNGPARQS